MAGLILETSFIVDLERESRRGLTGPAAAFLDKRPADRFYITPIVAGEVAAGGSMAARDTWDGFLTRFHVIPVDSDVCWEYGRAHRYLRTNGMLIGANDLWIAAAGLAYKMPVVTRNRRDFERVPGLDVISYALDR